ncbi:MAG: FeoA domain-containing protein [Ardenticatenia bacterium]|nr:FeoA domain-containing protein [Ardenticatenia bacterium]
MVELSSPMTGAIVALVATVVAVPALTWLREQYRVRRRETVEDALKALLELGDRVGARTPDLLAGRLHLSRRATLRLIQTMSERGLVRVAGEGIQLTPMGKALALHVLRAHRLWECYLSDDAAVPLKDIHRLAEKAEHKLSPGDVRRLEVRMGYPSHDPHGDPIPREDEAGVKRPGTPLTAWPVGQPARIVHIEDEPESVFAQILAEGLTPGTLLTVIERSAKGIRLQAEGNEVWLAAVLAAHIHVVPSSDDEAIPTAPLTLAEVPEGHQVQVVGLSSEVRGLLRRRLLDLGFTRGAIVEPVLHSAFGRGDPTAYRVRGTLIALRRDQARHIFVTPLNTPSEEEQRHEHTHPDPHENARARHAHP